MGTVEDEEPFWSCRWSIFILELDESDEGIDDEDNDSEEGTAHFGLAEAAEEVGPVAGLEPF